MGYMVALSDPRLREFLIDLVGDEGMRVAEALARRGEATDTELAEELNSRPSHIRRVLYELYEARAAEYQKKKDTSNGWITFHWATSPELAQRALEQKRARDVAKLQSAIMDMESHDYYTCPSCTARFDFAAATDHNFHCPDHGDLLDAVDTAQEIAAMRDRLQALTEVPRSDRGNG